MNTIAGPRGLDLFPASLNRARRFLRSPKGYLLVALLGLAALALPAVGAGGTSVLAWAVVGAAGMELVLVRMGTGVWRAPSSAVLSGMIVGMILGPREPWYAALSAGVLATDAKHLLRLGRAHIPNPAAVGLIAAYALFGSGQSWWGALPDLPAVAIVPLLAACYLVAARANKLPAALAFLTAYFGLFTVHTFTGDAGTVAEIFRPPYVNAALFFAFFMVTDPPTSPVPFRDQLPFGVAVAVACYGVYEWTHAVYYLPAGLLAGNVLYAAWREFTRVRRRPPAVATFGPLA